MKYPRTPPLHSCHAPPQDKRLSMKRHAKQRLNTNFWNVVVAVTSLVALSGSNPPFLAVSAFQLLPPTLKIRLMAPPNNDSGRAKPMVHRRLPRERLKLLVSCSTSSTDATTTAESSSKDDATTIVSANNVVVNGDVHTNVNGVATTMEKNDTTLGSNTTAEVPMPTANGGYTHTTASRAKISAANKGKVPWNKGKTRSEQERARIAAGVRAKNRQRFLEKLEALGMTEEEYNEEKKAERCRKDQERRARKTANGGYRPTEETKQKISAILKEKWAKGEMKKRRVHPEKVRRGFTHSAETRAKISASLKKRWAHDPNYRNVMMQKSYASNSSEHVKKRISESLKKKWQDPEFREAMLTKMVTRRQPTGPHDMSHREKISAAMKAKWQDEEYRAKTLKSVQNRRMTTTPPMVSSKTTSTRLKPKLKTTRPRPVPADGIRVAKPVPPKPTKIVAKKPKPRVIDSAPPQVAKKRAPKSKKTTVVDVESKEEPDGSIHRLREERRDLYDLLYGEEGSSSFARLDLEDENLDTFDPYGLEDF